MREAAEPPHDRCMTNTDAITTQTRTPLETVGAMYQAFGAGDVAAIQAMVTPDVDWSLGLDPSVPGADAAPNLGRFTGPDGVAAYFQAVAETFEFSRFEPHWMTQVGDEVVVLLSFDLTMKATGRPVSLEEIHRFHFTPDGRIDRYRPHLDTATLLAAGR